MTIEIATEGFYSESTEISGIALRDEIIITVQNAYNSITYNINDGERVGKYSIIAHYSRDILSAEDQRKVDFLNRKIEQLEKSTENRVQFDIVTLDKQIKTEINNFVRLFDEKNLKDISQKADALQIYFNRKDIKINDSSYYEEVLTEYKKEKEQILSLNNTSEEYIKSPSAGYFYSEYDGYEYINVSDYQNPTVNDIQELQRLQEKPLPSNYIGKLQRFPSWYFAAVIDIEAASNLSVGSSAVLEFELLYAGTKQLYMTVESISKSDNGKVAVLFRCDTLNNDISSLRKEACLLILKTYTGIRVSNEAIRVSGGVNGVYVLSGQRVLFKPITIIYAGNDFSIIEAAQTGSRVLTINDELILGGKDMFDGKVVDIK